MRYMCRSASRARRPSPYRLMAARGLWALRSVEQQLGVVRFLRTLALFISAAVCFAPTLAAVHVVVNVIRSLWLRILRWRFPHSMFEETPCIRTAMDTRRTQGFTALLLQIRGRCDPEAIAQRLEKEVVWRRASEEQLKKGWGGAGSIDAYRRHLAYPQLSLVLTTRWGRYAWEEKGQFNIDNHVVLASQLFRGRPVTEFNVQEYVSDIVSKYLPPNVPPWQATIIPVFSPEERYFILLRLHHLACKGFVLDHLQKAVLAGEEPLISCPPSSLLPPSPDTTPLSVVPTPTLTPPSPDKLSTPRAKALWSLASHLRTSLSLAWSEVSAPSSVSQTLYSMGGMMLGLASEARNLARREGTTYELVREAMAEALFLMGVAFEGPMILLRELLPDRPEPHDHSPRRQSGHHLQSVSLCGRKAVAWSDPAPVELVNKICAATGSSNTEVLLTAASGALRQFFRQSGLPTPGVVTAALPLPLSIKGEEDGGFALIALPTREEDGSVALDDLRKQLREQRKRPASLLLSAWLSENAARILPSFAIRLLLNALTRKYSVTISNIPAGSFGFRLWGQDVESLLYWRPQQANTSMSLSLMTYKGSVRLGVMADQQLSPQHSAIATAFVPQLCDLAVSVGVPRERLPSASTRPTSPRGSPWISPLASPRPSPKPSPKTSPDPSPPILRKTKATFLELPPAQPRRRRGDSGGSGCESDESSESSASGSFRKQNKERAAALESAVAHKFRGAIDSD